jgi:TolB-like protein
VFRLEDGNVAGDGVNIAARLESKAPVGGICISQTVYDTVKGKLPMQATFMGPQSFKNISEPIPIWHVMPEGGVSKGPVETMPRAGHVPALRSRRVWIAGASSAVALSAVGSVFWLRPEWPGAKGSLPAVASGSADIKSIAVLPFTNMSADKDAAYFADGIHEDLLTQLGLLGDLKVVSRTSVMEYRNSTKNMRQIGTELGVGALVEGSVRRAGNQVRVTAQLIDAKADRHLWAKNYDREMKDIFAVQSELATQIAGALHVSLSPREQVRLARKPTENLEAYDLLLRHQELFNGSVASMRFVGMVPERAKLLERAVQLDPDFALAWARLGVEYGRMFRFNLDPSRTRKLQAEQALARALALAKGDPQVKIEEGSFFTEITSDPARAMNAYREVLQGAPNHVPALIGMAIQQSSSAPSEALSALEKVLSVDPRNIRALNTASNIYLAHRHFDRALALRRQLLELRPDDLDLRANYHRQQYWATGSWQGYDQWRATLASGAESKSLRVRNADVERALSRRDFPTALRAVGIRPEDFKAMMGTSDGAQMLVDRASVLRASGDRAAALSAAKVALAALESELKKAPEDLALLEGKAIALAHLQKREAAFAALAKAVEVSISTGKLYMTAGLRETEGDLHALLGDRGEFAASIRKQLTRPGSRIHEFRNSASFIPFADDPEFKAIVADPASNAPLSLTAKY